MLNKFSDYMLNESEDTIVDPKDLTFFEIVGMFLNSLDKENVNDKINDMLSNIVDNVFDIFLELEDVELGEETDDLLLYALESLDIEEDIEEEEGSIDDEEDGDDEDVDEGLTVKPRKTKSGRKKSTSSRLKGVRKTKYLKRLRARRMKYKKSAMLKKKAKRIAKKYKRTARAKIVKKKYKQFHKKKK